jgi:hypothetical protein
VGIRRFHQERNNIRAQLGQQAQMLIGGELSFRAQEGDFQGNKNKKEDTIRGTLLP